MLVKVLFFGILKDLVGCGEEWIEVAPDSTVSSLFALYAKRFATLEASRSSILFARNREFSRPEAVLDDHDEVAFLPPVSGGSEGTDFRAGSNLFAITRDLIDSKSIADSIKRPEDGAVVVFEGVVRNNTQGRGTSYLEYDSYEEMALSQITRIGEELAARFPIGRIAIVQRLGRLAVGEASVAVIATAAHRRPAFEAALEGIDRLKREVAIWKKEIFADGAEWVEGEWDSHLLANAVRNEAS